MDTSEIGVLIGGVLLIGLILWYFFGARDEAQTVGSAPMHHGEHHH